MQPNLHSAFDQQSRACAAMGSDFMANLMQILPQIWPQDTQLAAMFAAWQGELGPNAASLPLRLAGGLHYLVQSGQAADIAALYPPNPANFAGLAGLLATALQCHDAFLCDWCLRAPQTNETGRAAILIAAAAELAPMGLPFKLSELGASAGLNLMFDRFCLSAAGQVTGPSDSPLQLMPDWRGAPPKPTAFRVASRAGVDITPLDPARDADRLLAYLWPDQPERIKRMRAAISLAEVTVDLADAADWLDQRLTQQADGQIHLIYHTIAYQYFPQHSQDRIRNAIESAGARATQNAPIAWLAMEADDQGQGAGITLAIWPQGIKTSLGRAGFHGQWVEWRGL